MAKRVACQRTTLIAYFVYNIQNANGQNVVNTDWSCLENSRKSLVNPIVRRNNCWANVFHTSRYWWMLLPLPPAYCRTRHDLFRTSPDCWWHRAFDVSSYLRSTGITTRQHRMGHMHAGNMYRSRGKEAKESFCDYLTILLSFESESVMGKILRRYVARYTTSTHLKWRHHRGCLQQHPTTPWGQINVDEQRLTRLFGNAACYAACFITCKNVTCQSSIGCEAWLR